MREGAAAAVVVAVRGAWGAVCGSVGGCGAYRLDAHIVLGHHVRTVREKRNAAKSFSLALGAEHTR